VASIADYAIHAAPCVQRQVLDEHFFHQCAQCAIKLADLAAGRVDDDAYEIEPLARSDSARCALTDNTAVDDRDLLGLETQAGFDFSADNKVFKLGFRPSGKRYKRVTVTPANNTGNVFLAGLWLTLPLVRPTPNPPV